MSDKRLSDLAETMRGIDIAMLTTRTDGGQLAARPMSNNGEVEYDGDSYYFTSEQSRMVRDIGRDPKVGLGFSGRGGVYLAVAGEAELIRDKSAFEAHWSPDLDTWFENGIETPGLVMIKVRAKRIKYWDGEDDGEVEV